MTDRSAQEPAGDGPRVPPERPGPPGGKRDLNRRERTRALQAAGLALFLEQGVEAVPVEAIAHRAGLAKGSFYRYFRDKRELVASLLDPVAAGLREAFATCREALQGEVPLAAYLELGTRLAALVTEQADVARLYLQEGRSPGVGARAPVAELAELIGREALDLTHLAQGRGIVRAVEPEVSTLAVIGAAERLLQAWLAGQLQTDGAVATAALVDLLLGGLHPSGGGAG